MLSINYQIISLKLKEFAKRVAEKSMSRSRPYYVKQSLLPMWEFLLTEHGSVKA